jgi:hypothetical protein
MNEGYGSNPYGNPSANSLGAIAGGIGSFFGKNPANAANQYFNQIPGQLGGIYNPWTNNGINALNPYLQGGQQAGQQLQGQIGNLLNNPTGMMNQWGSTYQSSPGYNWQVGQATDAANNAAAAGGMAGSPAEQQQLAGTVNQLANQDYWQYLGNAQNLYSQGLQGELGVYGIGANAANNAYSTGANMANEYGQQIGQNLTNQGMLGYMGQINQNQSLLGGLGAIGAGVGGLLGQYGQYL